MAAPNASDPNYDFYLQIIDEPAFWLALAVPGFILASVIILGNSFLIFTMHKDPRKSLRSPPAFLVANLGASDLLLGMFTVFFVALRDVYRYRQVHMPFVGVFKAVMYTVLTTTLFASIYSIIAMSAACYVAINKPMDYKTIITKRRIKVFIALLWVISVSTCVLPATSIPEKIYTMIYLHTHVSLPAILLTVIYVKVYRALSRRTRELQENGLFSSVNSANVLERERKMSITIIIILTMFFVSYLPQYITLHLLYFCTVCQQSVTFHKIDVVLSRFLFLNSAINPFIYAWKVPRYRRAFIDCLKILLRQKIQSSVDGSVSLASRRTGLQSVNEHSSREIALVQLGNNYKEKKLKKRKSDFTII